MNLINLSIVDVRHGLQTKQFSCVEYVGALLEEAVRRSALNCFVNLDAGRLLREARLFDGQPKTGPLAGIPIGFKDNIDVRGVPTTAGTRKLRSNIATEHAPVASRLFDAGALFLGKLNMHELALGITSNNGWLGACRNPFDLELSPGGSSGGNGAALAARLAPGAIGTDTGGSIRLPAALCGVVGLRPTAGRYPQAGIVPVSHTRDTAGPMARCVEDVALLDAVVTGERAHDAVELSGLRLGLLREATWERLERGVQNVCERALDVLRKAGVILVEVTVENLEPLNAAAGFPVVLYELIRDLPAYLRSRESALTIQSVIDEIRSPDVAQIMRLATDNPVQEAVYAEALAARFKLKEAYRQCFHTHRLDAIILPTSPITARPIGADETVELEGEQVPTFATFIRHTDYASNAGLPGISLPAGLVEAGLPVGLELDGPEGSDRRLLAIAAAIERELPSVRLVP